MFSEIWRWVEISKYKVLKSLKGWGEGRCLNPTPPPKKPSMEGKWTIPVMKYHINDTEQ